MRYGVEWFGLKQNFCVNVDVVVGARAGARAGAFGDDQFNFSITVNK